LPLQLRPHRYNEYFCVALLPYCTAATKQTAGSSQHQSFTAFVVYLDMDPKAAPGRAPNGSSLIAANAITLDRHKEAFNKHHK